MLKFFYNPSYKYTNRTKIDVSSDTSYREIDYLTIDTPDMINGHIIYKLTEAEALPTYVVSDEGRKWFVTGLTPLSSRNKYQISLLRDIISEEDQSWMYLDYAYIDAGQARSDNFNKYKRWGLPYTNTKIKQERLNFGGKSSFFVFYVNEQNVNGDQITESDYSVDVTSTGGQSYSGVKTVASISSINGSEFLNAGNVVNFENYQGTARLKTYLAYQSGTYAPSPSECVSKVTNEGEHSVEVLSGYTGYTNCIQVSTIAGKIGENVNGCKTDLATAVQNACDAEKASAGTNIPNTKLNSLLGYVDGFVYASDVSKLYKITYTQSYFERSTLTAPSALTTAIRNISFPQAPGKNASTYAVTGSGYFQFYGSGNVYNFALTEIGLASSIKIKLSAGTRKLPRSAVRCLNIVSGASASIGDDAIAQALMTAQSNEVSLGENIGQIIDVQYLPFSIATTVATYTQGNESIPYVSINGVGQYSAFLELDDYSFFTNLTDLTNINKETDSINIVSPSRKSQFLFRPYNNDGVMEFTTNVTIKPYASIIYVRPSTKGLLLNDWDDKNCLVINEDFSLTKVSTAWADYVRSNKNYQVTFNRDIQGREFSREWERRVENVQAQSDEYNAKALARQYGQSISGNIPLISSAVGLITQGLSTIPGTNSPYNNYMEAARIDRQYNEAVYQESVSLARDQFKYQLENVQSQPMIPSSVTSIDCKLLDGVYLEYYSTNATELESINWYYRMNGNRIESYGYFSDYANGNFIRGKIVRDFANLKQAELDELNRRLQVGIFLS